MKIAAVVSALLVGLFASAAAMPQSITCRDVIDAKDSSAINESVLELRNVAFKVSAHHHADALYRGLQQRGVAHPLPAVLDEYESVFLPVRDGASPAFDG